VARPNFWLNHHFLLPWECESTPLVESAETRPFSSAGLALLLT
jgi:hypothetical protein